MIIIMICVQATEMIMIMIHILHSIKRISSLITRA